MGERQPRVLTGEVHSHVGRSRTVCHLSVILKCIPFLTACVSFVIFACKDFSNIFLSPF